MAYTNVTTSIASPISNYADSCAHPSNPKNRTFFKESVLSRGAHFTSTPVYAFTNTIDTIIGLVAGIGALCTLGMHKPSYTFACKHIICADFLISDVYLGLIKMINPRLSLDDSANKAGMITEFVSTMLEKRANAFRDSDSIFKSHVASRLTIALLALSSIVTRVADGIIGLGAAGLSILCLGKVDELNSLAYRGLQVTGIISDLFVWTVMIINPWAELENPYEIFYNMDY